MNSKRFSELIGTKLIGDRKSSGEPRDVATDFTQCPRPKPVSLLGSRDAVGVLEIPQRVRAPRDCWLWDRRSLSRQVRNMHAFQAVDRLCAISNTGEPIGSGLNRLGLVDRLRQRLICRLSNIESQVQKLLPLRC